MATVHSFTVTGTGFQHVLKTECSVSPPHNAPGDIAPDGYKSFQAIWDTGATGSCITQAVVDAVGLVATGMTQVHGVHGVTVMETYIVNIRLANGVQFANVLVTKGILPGGPGGDLLIGMDIITTGDFAVTNKGGKTVFSFRTPTQAHIDFVAEGNAILAAQQAAARSQPRRPSSGPPGPLASTRQQRREAERKAKKGR